MVCEKLLKHKIFIITLVFMFSLGLSTDLGLVNVGNTLRSGLLPIVMLFNDAPTAATPPKPPAPESLESTAADWWTFGLLATLALGIGMMIKRYETKATIVEE